jgi:hypothetical protein
VSDLLNLACSLSLRSIPASGAQRLVYLLAEVTGGQGAQTLPGNLGFIIDASDSMRIRLVTNEQFAALAKNGMAQEVMTDGVPAYQLTAIPSEMIASFPRRIDYVSEALIVASEYLRPVDRFSLVAFAGQAHMMIPSVTGKDKNRLHQAARELEFLRLGDSTQMAEGIAMAFSEVNRQPKESFASRLILLTDGHTRNVNECYDWAREARQAGLKLTTMGIGVEFNEDLLIPLADLTGGNAYYIERPDQIPEAFRNELGAAQRISYRNVEIKLQLPGGVELRRVYRVLPELSGFDRGPDMDGSFAMLLGDYDPTTPFSLLMELVLPPWQIGRYRLAQVLLAWDDPDEGGGRQNQRQEIVIEVSEEAESPPDTRVIDIVDKVGAFKMGTQALEAAQNASRNEDPQEKGAATVRLRQAATRLLDMGESNLADTMLRQAEILEHGGNMDPEAAKKLRYETRRLTQHT